MGEVDEVTEADLRRPRRRPPELSRIADGPSRPRAGDQDPRADRPACGWPVCSSGETLELLRDACAPGVTTGELDAIAEDNIRSHGGVAVVPGLRPPPFPGHHLRVGQRRGRARHPGRRVLVDGDVISIDCGAIVDGWHGDAAITVAVGEVPAEVTELMRVTEEALWARDRRRPPRRPGHRHLPRGRDPRAGAGRLRHPRGLRRPRHRHRRCTSRPTCPTSAAPAAGPSWCQGLALAVEPMVTLGSKRDRRARRRLDRGHRRRLAGRPTSSTPSRSPRRRLGADRARRRRGGARRARRPLRRSAESRGAAVGGRDRGVPVHGARQYGSRRSSLGPGHPARSAEPARPRR